LITVTAKLTVTEGKGADFEAAARKMIAAVKANEAGKTLSYDLFKSPTEANVYLFIETYADDEALAAHRTTPHMGEFGAALGGGLLSARTEIARWQPV
jgi:quinol monooxygenase YgiN